MTEKLLDFLLVFAVLAIAINFFLNGGPAGLDALHEGVAQAAQDGRDALQSWGMKE